MITMYYTLTLVPNCDLFPTMVSIQDDCLNNVGIESFASISGSKCASELRWL